MPLIEFEHVTKKYGEEKALDDVSFVLPSGRRTVIIGASGAGKTTILRLIAGLEMPDEGRVLFDGRDVRSVPPSERGIGMIFQDAALFPHSTVEANISYGMHRLGFSKSEISEKVREAAGRLKIGKLLGRYPGSLSAGERQRAGIARALVRRPSVLLLDEPFANLDQRLREELQKDVRELQEKEQSSFILVTHDQNEALAEAEELIVLSEGRVIDTGDVSRVYRDPSDLRAAMFVGPAPLNLFAVRREKGIWTCAGRELHVSLPEESRIIGAVRPEKMRIAEKGIACRLISSTARFGGTLLECQSMYGKLQAIVTEGENAGSSLNLSFDEGDLMLFDEETNQRIQMM